jgi:hypothetical protein
MQWRTGRRHNVTSVCAGDLITVRLALAAGESGETDDVNAQYQQPHLVYAPSFSGEGVLKGTVGGQTAPSSDPLEYRVDLCALWCPYNGQIALDGGGGLEEASNALYDVWFERVRCAPRPPDDPTFMLRKVDDPVRVPRGAYAVSVPQTASIAFRAGVQQTFSIDPGQRFLLGGLSVGTVEPGIAGPGGTIQAIVFHLRF